MAPNKGSRFCAEIRNEFCVKMIGLSHKNPALFVTLQCFSHPLIYTIWSGVWALFFLSMLMLDVYYNKHRGAEYLVFLTNLTYMVQTVSLLLDFTVTVFVYFHRSDIPLGKTRETPWYLKLQWVMFNITNTTSLTVTLMYYTLLSPVFTHGSINTHLLNSVHTLLNILVCAKPVRILHVYQPMIYAAAYIAFSVIYHLLGADPIYDPLDWNKTGSTLLTVFMILFVAVPIVHVFVFYSLYTARVFVSEHCCGMTSRVGPDPEVVDRDLTADNIDLGVDFQASAVHSDSQY